MQVARTSLLGPIAAATQEKTRQLLCVVFADMAGYSALTSRDEDGTHRMWMQFIADVVRPKAGDFGGSIVRTLGDGILLTFSSSSAALEWSIAIQNRIQSGRTGKTARFPGLSLRIAVHICEAIVEGDDVYGDGVNVTKRLQESIAPDGIIISDDLCNSTRKNMPLEVRNLGYLTLKNISDPIRAFEVLRPENAGDVGLAAKMVDLPSIAVLPLQNLNDDMEFNYFADGVVEDIITSLASFKELLVISRASALAFGSGAADPREVGRILDVRYVLIGTLRRSASELRLSVSLCDTSNGEIVFSDKSDFPHNDLFATQDRIVEHIVSRIAPNLHASERAKALRKPPDNFTAYDLTLKALDMMTTLEKSSFDEALKYLKAAMELDAEFAMPVAYAARWHCIYIGQGWEDDRAACVEAAKTYASRAVRLDRQNALGLAAYGHVKSYLERDYDTALVFLDRAREMGPSQSLSWILSSGTLSYVGRHAEAVEHAQHGLRLSPNDPDLFQYYDFLCLAHYLNESFDEAVKWGEQAYAERSDYTSNWRQMVISNAASGKLDRAKEFAGKILDRDPDFRVDRYLKDYSPFRETRDREMISRHMRLAGLN